MEEHLSNEVRDFLSHHERILKEIQDYLRSVPDRNYHALKEIQENVERLNNDVKEAKEEDVPSLMYQLRIQHNLAAKLSENAKMPDEKSPYFGHMKIEQNGAVRDVYLGHVHLSIPDKEYKIIDWKKSPLAQVYYGYNEGDDYEIDLEEREIEGRLIEKSVMTVLDGILTRVDRSGETWILRDGGWKNLTTIGAKLEGGEAKAYNELGSGMTNFSGPDVLSLLDQKQYDLVNRGDRKPLLIVGGAGSGKTTVALIRIAKLCERNKIYPNQALVLVPNQGLVQLSNELLKQIGLPKVRVQVMDVWFQNIARRLMKELPKRVNYSTPLSVSIVKKHRAMKPALQGFVNRQIENVREKIARLDRPELLEVFDEESMLPLIKRIDALKRCPMDTQTLIAFKAIRKTTTQFREDLYHFFTDPEMLEHVKKFSDGSLTERMIRDTRDYVTRQISNFDSDRSYLEREGSEDSEKSHDSIDYEDFVLLLTLIQLKHGALSEFPQVGRMYRHIVVDESQEVTDLEFNTISNFIHKKGSVTVAGDAVQQIDPSTSFAGWHNVMEQIGLGSADVEELNVSYRSPKEIVKFAHHVLGPLAPKELPETKREGGPVLQTQVQHLAHASLTLSDALRDLTTREPKASIAVICNTQETAREIFTGIEEVGNVRLVKEATFSFKPGIDVTTVDAIRGLEFDYVIIPDADRENYPETARARKRLHLAATRAIHQLWVLYSGKRSVLIADS